MLPEPEGVEPQMQRASVPASFLPQVTIPAGANAPSDTGAVVVAPVTSPTVPQDKPTDPAEIHASNPVLHGQATDDSDPKRGHGIQETAASNPATAPTIQDNPSPSAGQPTPATGDENVEQPPAKGDVVEDEIALESAKAGGNVVEPKSSKKRKNAPEKEGEDEDKDEDPQPPAAKKKKTGSGKAVATRAATSQKSKSPKSASKKKA